MPRRTRAPAVGPGEDHREGGQAEHHAEPVGRPAGDGVPGQCECSVERGHERSTQPVAADEQQRQQAGLTDKNCFFNDEAVTSIIRSYTREAGVRNLEREIATLIRKQTRRLAEGATDKLVITPEVVREKLGVQRYRVEREVADRVGKAGVAVGLAWTPAGGDVIFIEATAMRGGRQLTMTGHLGEVMQESGQAALSYVRSRAADFGLTSDFYRNLDIHLHIPEGAIPKDGPSAGITLATAVVSALTKVPVRKGMAMTGEITLRGKVLPIGGGKEKLLAAHRTGSRTVILPRDNEKDLADIPPNIQQELAIKFVETMDEVLDLALDGEFPARPEMPVEDSGLQAHQPTSLESEGEHLTH